MLQYLRIWMLELLYDKYCVPFDILRVTLFYTYVWLKHYPHDALLPRYQPLHLPKIGVFAAKRHVKRCVVFHPIKLLDIPRSALR